MNILLCFLIFSHFLSIEEVTRGGEEIKLNLEERVHYVDEESVLKINFNGDEIKRMLDSLGRDDFRIELIATVIREDGDSFNLLIPMYSVPTRKEKFPHWHILPLVRGMTRGKRPGSWKSTFVETELNIKESGLSRGDQIRLKIRELNGDMVDVWILKIERFGFDFKISFPISIILPVGGKLRGPWPGITYSVRYKGRDKFLSFLGLGLNLTLLDFDPDEIFEPGLGGVLTLWNDRLQGGAGYDLKGGGSYFTLSVNLSQFFPF
jgi:hypothetical protein